MKKKIRLENTQNNSNKFYEMDEGNGGIFIATWGRIGSSVYPAQKTYQMSEWDKVLDSKIKKGYVLNKTNLKKGVQMKPTKTTTMTRTTVARRIVGCLLHTG